jgi:hypothetical protein
MNELELAAGDIAAAVLEGEAVALDVPGAPDRTVDFEVRLPGGRRVALEVTTATEEDAQRLRVAALGRQYSASELANDWQLGVIEEAGREPVNIRALIAGIVPVLEVFERRGITEVETRQSPQYRRPAPGTAQEVVDATLEQFKLGAILTRSWGPRQSPDAASLLLSIHGGFSADIDKVNELAAIEAKANSAKLAAADADERHLFMWLTLTHPDAELAVHTGPPPSTLPSGVDVLWLATQGGAEGFGKERVERLWRVRPRTAGKCWTPRGSVRRLNGHQLRLTHNAHTFAKAGAESIQSNGGLARAIAPRGQGARAFTT